MALAAVGLRPATNRHSISLFGPIAGNVPAGTETGHSGLDDESGRLPIATRRLYSSTALTEEGDGDVLRRTLARWLFDELAQRLTLRSAPRPPDPETAEIPGTPSDAGNERTATRDPTVGTLLHLASLGVVATTRGSGLL